MIAQIRAARIVVLRDMKPLVTAIATLVLVSCASAPTPREQFPAVRSVELISIRGRALPELQHDFLLGVVDSSAALRRMPAERESLTGPVNDYLNGRLAELNAGTFNAIVITIDSRHTIRIAPPTGVEPLDTVVVEGSATHGVFDTSGTLLWSQPEELSLLRSRVASTN